jgi:hypothetical protein
VQQVEEEEVGEQTLAGATCAGAGEDDLPGVHRLANPVGALALAEQGTDRRRVAQPVDQVGERRDRLLREQRKRSIQNPCEAFGRKGRTAARQRSLESRVGSWKIVGASSGGRTGAILASAPAACVVRLIARVLCSPHCRVEANASTITSTRDSALPPLSSKRFQPGRLSIRGALRSISTTLAPTSGSSK